MATRGYSVIRPFLRLARCRASSPRYLASASTTSTPAGKAADVDVDPRIHNIVDQISSLTLLQAADLVAALKTRLNIQQVVAPVAAVSAAPAPEAVEAPAEEKPKEKTIFTVKLESFEASAKPKIIREVKSIIPNLTLIDAKKFVESVPTSLRENLPKEEAEKLKETFEKLGAKVTLE